RRVRGAVPLLPGGVRAAAERDQPAQDARLPERLDRDLAPRIAAGEDRAGAHAARARGAHHRRARVARAGAVTGGRRRGAGPRRAPSRRLRAERNLGWALCAPAVLVMLAVTAYPIGHAVSLSLQRFDLRFPDDAG